MVVEERQSGETIYSLSIVDDESYSTLISVSADIYKLKRDADFTVLHSQYYDPKHDKLPGNRWTNNLDSPNRWVVHIGDGVCFVIEQTLLL